MENHQLRLEVHRWRKQHALVKLRLAGAQEDSDLQASHCRQLEARLDTLEAARAALSAEVEALRGALAGARGQLAELADAKCGTEQEAAKLKARRARATGAPGCASLAGRGAGACVQAQGARAAGKRWGLAGADHGWLAVNPQAPRHAHAQTHTHPLNTRRRTWATPARTSAA